MKYDLFISYSRADYWDKNECVIPGNIVSQIVETLEAYQQHYKFEYFFDQEAIESRAAYLKRIASVIDESKVMLFVASKNSYASDFCAKELNFADKRDIPIFQYCIDSAKMPLDIELLLGNHQFRHIKHFSVEKIVQDALREALGCQVKSLEELSKSSSGENKKEHSSMLDSWISFAKKVISVSKRVFVTIAVASFSIFMLFLVIGSFIDDKEPVPPTEQVIPPLVDQNIIPIEIDSLLTAEQLFSKGKEYFNKKDYNSAVQYYYKSAHMGYSKAQNNLGICYEKGHGVTRDYAEAVKWYRKAAEQGHEKAKENLRRLGYTE